MNVIHLVELMSDELEDTSHIRQFGTLLFEWICECHFMNDSVVMLKKQTACYRKDIRCTCSTFLYLETSISIWTLTKWLSASASLFFLLLLACPDDCGHDYRWSADDFADVLVELGLI